MERPAFAPAFSLERGGARIGTFAELYSETASLFAFLGCFFATLWAGWWLAVVRT